MKHTKTNGTTTHSRTRSGQTETVLSKSHANELTHLSTKLETQPTREASEAALRRLRPTLDALSVAEAHVGLNFRGAMAAGLGLQASSGLLLVIDELAAATRFGRAELAALHDASLALIAATHANAAASVVDPADAADRSLVDEAFELARGLRAQAVALAGAGIVPDAPELHGRATRRSLPGDLARIGAYYTRHADALREKVYRPWAELERVHELHAPIVDALASTGRRSKEAAAALDTYHRAASWFRKQYLAARRAVAYGFADDAEKRALVPPLASTRRRTRVTSAMPVPVTPTAPAEASTPV